jgi:hypothetical protein
MAKNRYAKSTVIFAEAVFSDPDNSASPLDPETGHTLLDPSTVICRLRRPDASLRTFTYGVDNELTRREQGKYRFTLTLDQIGTYRWAWAPSAGITTATEFDECDSYSVHNL